jgi:hypothetical protein
MYPTLITGMPKNLLLSGVLSLKPIFQIKTWAAKAIQVKMYATQNDVVFAVGSANTTTLTITNAINKIT